MFLCWQQIVNHQPAATCQWRRNNTASSVLTAGRAGSCGSKKGFKWSELQELKSQWGKKKPTLVQTDIPTTTGWTFIKTGLSEAHFDALSHCVTKKLLHHYQIIKSIKAPNSPLYTLYCTLMFDSTVMLKGNTIGQEQEPGSRTKQKML